MSGKDIAETIKEALNQEDLVNDLKKSTITDLLKEQQKIEESTELSTSEKGWKKVRNRVVLKFLGHKDPAEEADKDPFTETAKSPESDKKLEAEAERIIEGYDGAKPLLFIEKVTKNTKEFTEKVVKIAKNIGMNPNRLMQVMYKESRLDPARVNDDGGATGLIQFMPKTAKGLKTTVAELKKMSNIDQLDYVEKYYLSFKNKIHSYTDLYLATFYPVALNKPDSFILGSEVSDSEARKIGKQNNMNNRKPIAVKDVKARISQDIPSEYIAQFQGRENTLPRAA